jgi:hypothetical protein
MRFSYVAPIFTAFFLIMAAPVHVHAAGNVLVPTETTPPSDDTSEGSDDNASSNQPQQSTPPQAAPTPTPPPGKSATSTPPKIPQMPQTPTKLSTIKPPSKAMLDAWNKRKLPNALNVGFAENPVMGNRDALAVKLHLGLQDDAAKKSCSLVLNGNLQSSKGVYVPPYNMMAAHFTIKYDGKLTNASFSVLAACTKPANLPTNAGSVIQIGDKDIVPLSHVSCPAPANQSVAQLAIKYGGDGNGQCIYQ